MKVKEIARKIVALRTQRALLVDLCDHLGRLDIDKDPSHVEAVNDILLEAIEVRDKEVSKLENSEVSGERPKAKPKEKSKSKAKPKQRPKRKPVKKKRSATH